MTTSNLLLSQATKHGFDRSDEIVWSLNSFFAPEAIRPAQGASQPDPRWNEECSLAASQTVVQRIRAERLARGWTQKDLAARSGIERANIARLEAGKHSPRVDTLESLAKPLGLSLAELFESAREAAEFTELNLRLARGGVARLKANLKRQLELGIIDKHGRRTKRELPAEMREGTSEAV